MELNIIPLILFNLLLFIKIDRNIKDMILSIDFLILIFQFSLIFRIFTCVIFFIFLIINYKKVYYVIKNNLLICIVLLFGAVYFYFFYIIGIIIPSISVLKFKSDLIFVFLYLFIIYLMEKFIYEFYFKKAEY